MRRSPLAGRTLAIGLAVVGALLVAAGPAAADGDTTPPVGTLTLFGGDAATNATLITADTPATDDLSGVTMVELSNNGTAWEAFPYPGPGIWDISDASTGGTSAVGTHTVYARWTDGAGNVSVPVSKGILYDPVAPTLSVTFTDDGGSATNNPNLTLHIDATDNIGVTQMEIVGPGDVHLSQEYSPTISWDLGAAAPDGFYDFSVTVRDQVNQTWAYAAVFLDRTAPTFAALTDHGMAEGMMTFSISAADMGDITYARFSPDGGATWGAPVPVKDGMVHWDPLDPTAGGSKTLGDRTIHVQVRDAAGNWSNAQSAIVKVVVPLALDVSSNPTTGEPITFTLDWGGAVTLPSGSMCLWEFMWGDDASIYLAERNETFGWVLTQGAASAGFCDHWTFTLPWTPVRQYLVSVRVMSSDWDNIGEDMLGNSPDNVAFTSTVGSTSRHITTSNLPLIYVLPEAYELALGEPAVYRAYAVGGARIRSSDFWSIQYVNVPERHPGSAILTFYPKTTGHLTVCFGREYRYPTQLGACFDPLVKAGNSGGGGRAATQSATPGPTDSSTSPAVSPGGSDVAVAAPPSDGPKPDGIGAEGSTPTPHSAALANGPTMTVSAQWVLMTLVLIGAGGLALANPRSRGAVTAQLDRLRRRRS